MDGATWITNAAVRSAPRPVRPRIRPAATSIAAHTAMPVTAGGRSFGWCLRLSRRASVPDSAVAEEEGTSAVQ